MGLKLTLFIFFLITGYCLGSVSSGVIVCRLLGLPDPRAAGSRNPGATNVLRVGGKLAALIVLIADIAKGYIPVLLAHLCRLDGMSLPLIMAATIFGHMFPVFFGFKGGKGVATAFGGILALSWEMAAGVLIVWLVVVAVTRYVSLASIVGAVSVPVFNEWYGNTHNFMVFVLLALIIIAAHHENIGNLIYGHERKLGQSALRT